MIERYPGLDDFTAFDKIGMFCAKSGKRIGFNDVMRFYAKQTATVDGRKK